VCTKGSPADTLLLFETKAGWNQHGGPELFTFANHDPEGGCVVLNDSTVRFVRTEDKFKQLRRKQVVTGLPGPNAVSGPDHH
jgi:hypothetical protein